jgi:hypothetical protein
MSAEDVVARLAIASWPKAIGVEGDRKELNWAIRTEVSVDPTITELGPELEAVGRISVTEAFGGLYSEKKLSTTMPSVKVVFIDERHLVVRITIDAGGLGASDPGMAAVIGVLGSIDSRFGVEELQGYPRRFWSLFFGARP